MCTFLRRGFSWSLIIEGLRNNYHNYPPIIPTEIYREASTEESGIGAFKNILQMQNQALRSPIPFCPDLSFSFSRSWWKVIGWLGISLARSTSEQNMEKYKKVMFISARPLKTWAPGICRSIWYYVKTKWFSRSGWINFFLYFKIHSTYNYHFIMSVYTIVHWNTAKISSQPLLLFMLLTLGFHISERHDLILEYVV